ncbi:uncharacterized protein RAG0_09541 [Rhynchosporium agropyri]|uniref:Uncharacterized protein n=1 Tax=Rhynchosporium agropyri TaxID=914238 RepID=A0A1E1KVY3_9HELO|nr:uncharacterized protein RAG0_09541 [Rhynchosporium agropyri]
MAEPPRTHSPDDWELEGMSYDFASHAWVRGDAEFDLVRDVSDDHLAGLLSNSVNSAPVPVYNYLDSPGLPSNFPTRLAEEFARIDARMIDLRENLHRRWFLDGMIDARVSNVRPAVTNAEVRSAPVGRATASTGAFGSFFQRAAYRPRSQRLSPVLSPIISEGSIPEELPAVEGATRSSATAGNQERRFSNSVLELPRSLRADNNLIGTEVGGNNDTFFSQDVLEFMAARRANTGIFRLPPSIDLADGDDDDNYEYYDGDDADGFEEEDDEIEDTFLDQEQHNNSYQPASVPQSSESGQPSTECIYQQFGAGPPLRLYDILFDEQLAVIAADPDLENRSMATDLAFLFTEAEIPHMSEYRYRLLPDGSVGVRAPMSALPRYSRSNNSRARFFLTARPGGGVMPRQSDL